MPPCRAARDLLASFAGQITVYETAHFAHVQTVFRFRPALIIGCTVRSTQYSRVRCAVVACLGGEMRNNTERPWKPA